MTETKHVEVPAGTIAYREFGSGPTLLFIHGLLVDGRLWDGVVERLADRFHCVVPDLPLGSHRTALRPDTDLSPPGTAALIDSFMAALNLREVTVVANDTGGALAQILATRHPERIARMVLTPCDAYENFPPRMFRYLLLVARIPGGVFLLAQSLRIRPIRTLPIGYGWLTYTPIPRPLLDDWLRPLMTSHGVRRDTAKLLRGARRRYTLEAAEQLRDFDRPTLVAFAPEDRFFPFTHAVQLVAALPKGRLARIEGSRSLAPLDQPETTANLIAEFMTDTAQPSDVLSDSR